MGGDMNQKETGKRIRSARTQRGLTQKQLAGATGIHERTLRNYENGTTQPHGVFLRVLQEALDLNPSTKEVE